MKLNLEKDIVFFDLETTGLSTSKDRIVQIGIVKVFADGRESVEKCRLINPTIPISKEASDIHGITNEDIKDEPTFLKLAKGLKKLIGDADLCGFNSNRFDVPMLMEEFSRVNVDFDMTNRKSIDAWKIFQKMEPRNLSAAYKFYCGKTLEGAHDALNDVRATAEILECQIKHYEGVSYEDGNGVVEENPINNNMQSLHDFTNFPGQLDYAGRIVLNENDIPVFNFGKYQNQSVTDVIGNNPGYYSWFMKGDFATDTKKVLENIMEKSRAEFYESKLQQ